MAWKSIVPAPCGHRSGGDRADERMGVAVRNAMKKRTALLICLALLVSLLSGCAAERPAGADTLPDPPQESPAETGDAPNAAEEPAIGTEEPSEETAQSSAEAYVSSEEENRPESHYVFQPKVCSSFMTELFGQTMVDTWYALVDAVMAGEDSFACPDAYTYDWVMGQFRDQCFPLLVELIDYCYDRSDPVHDGTATFTYLVPQEEAAARIADFAALVEDILNSALEDDYSDLEKALALYVYFSHHYIYDYDTAYDDSGYHDWLSAYRVLTGDIGICQEFSVAYSYLLLQAGVDATNMSGHRSFDHEGHQWSYVRINGHNFHIDPTYVIGTMDSLSYFMMDDAQREAEDGYSPDDFVICSNYAQDHPHPEYAADDDSFRDLWGGFFLDFDHETRTIHYEKYDEAADTMLRSFDYTGW